MQAEVIHSSCLDALPMAPTYDLVFADPPFNIGHPYKGFQDRKPRCEFENFTLEWVGCAWYATKGVLCLYGPDDLATLYMHAERVLGLHRIAWVNWHYNFGQCRRTNWIDSRTHCLIYAKDPENYTWNPESVLVPSMRVKYGDKRIKDSPRGGSRVPGCVWGIPSDGPHWGRVTGNSKERWKNHPNQLPIRFLRRLILAYTNPGDWVCDPFTGSGTTGLVANRENRRFTGFDISLENVESARERIKNGYYPSRFG